MRQPRAVPRQCSDESPMQTAWAGYLDGLATAFPCDIAWAHPPNEGHRNVLFAKKLKRQGVKSGDADAAIYLRGGCTVFAELKAMDGTISGDQMARLATFNGLGFMTYVVAAITPSAAVDAIAAVVRQEALGDPLQRAIGARAPFRVPFEGMSVLSWYVWPGRDIVALGRKSVLSIIRHTEKQSK